MSNKEIIKLQAIEKEIKKLSGHLGFYYKNLQTGFEYGVNENYSFLAASVIKFPLYLHVMNECEKGNMSFDDILTVDDDEKVPSCGAINLFTGAVDVDIRTLCKLMICISDNTATNRLIRHCSIGEIEQGFLKMNLEKTKIRRRLFDSESASKGIENTICPKEIGKLLEKLYLGEFISKEKSHIISSDRIGRTNMITVIIPNVPTVFFIRLRLEINEEYVSLTAPPTTGRL
jgi:beta-lactamase class A